MRWKKKEVKQKPKPKIKPKQKTPILGDTKVKTEYALFPVTIKEDVVWLEYYEEVFEYKEVTRPIKRHITYEDGSSVKLKGMISGLLDTGEYDTTHEWVKTKTRVKNAVE